jgi:hypothetical protein
MASRNGLNPKIKGPKGVGYGRALPSAFGFGNGIRPNPNRYEYITIPGLVGQTLPHQMTFELWINHDEEFTNNEGWLQYNDNYPTGSGEGNGAEIRSQVYNNQFFLLGQTAGQYLNQLSFPPIVLNQRNHLVVTIDLVNGIAKAHLNGNIETPVTSNCGYITTPYDGVFQLFNLFALTTQGVFASGLTDEFRIYSEVISDADITLGWNNGIGNNPAKTENLITWYKFEEFEELDFSAQQNGNNIQIGIRDYSQRNHHGLPIGMITDPALSGYPITVF